MLPAGHREGLSPRMPTVSFYPDLPLLFFLMVNETSRTRRCGLSVTGPWRRLLPGEKLYRRGIAWPVRKMPGRRRWKRVAGTTAFAVDGRLRSMDTCGRWTLGSKDIWGRKTFGVERHLGSMDAWYRWTLRVKGHSASKDTPRQRTLCVKGHSSMDARVDRLLRSVGTVSYCLELSEWSGDLAR
jgi:hypothetical protein